MFLSRGWGSAGLVFAVLLAGCSREEPAARAPAPVNRNFATPWQEESQYIVTMVASDLAEMAYYASTHQPLAAGAARPVVTAAEIPQSTPLAYRVTVMLPDLPEFSCDLPMSQAIWAPATYQPLTHALFEKLRVQPAANPAVHGTDLPATLTEPTAELLAGLDRKLSHELDGAFTAPAPHEQAALLLAAFALREASGNFHQQLVELSRMTAHLALADALRGASPRTPAGQIAGAVLPALYNNQVEALQLIEALPDDASVLPWKRALRARLTRDYRPLTGMTSRTLLEQREWFRAYADMVDVTQAWSKLEIRDSWKPLADWSRLANLEATSVQVGHVLLRNALPQELAEISQVYALEEGREIDSSDLVAKLNADPQRCVAVRASGDEPVRILGWGLWAAFLQRHLCHTITADFNFMQARWGVPAEAAKFRDEMDRLFWNLYLYPFVRRQNATETDYYRKAQDEEMALVRSRPHVVPARSWNIIDFKVPFAPLYWPPPHPFINEWHFHNPPPGTVYDVVPRLSHPSMVNYGDRPGAIKQLERLQALAPYEGELSRHLLILRGGDKPTPAQVLAAYGPLADYDTYVAAAIGRMETADDATREKWLRRWAEVNSLAYYRLGELYLKQGSEAEAAQAFQQWVNEEEDRVSVSNSVRWLVDYYERNGNPGRALELADEAAVTFSSQGLTTKAELLERRGDFDGAFDLHEARAKRYNDTDELLGFLVRRKEGGTGQGERYASRLKELMRQKLPGGLSRFELAAGNPPPERGVLVNTAADRVMKAGLKQNDVIVAVRGYTTYDWESFMTIRAFDSQKPYTMLVWRAGSYLKVGPLPGDYRFGVDLTDYRKP